jgi:cysteine desulfurase/selenocysteine lyase
MQGMSEITTKLDVAAIRADFPTLSREVRPGVPLIYLDNAATSQKPVAVIEAMEAYYRTYTANVHRGLHTLSEEATDAYEGARRKIARFVNAGSHREIIYTRNTTESINLVAWTWGRVNLGPGDTILASEMEHHSNMVPWQLLAEQTGAELAYIPITDEGLLDMDAFDVMLDERVKLVAIAHMSNVLGTINPVAEIVRRAHTVGALVLVDGAQSVPHVPVDVRAIDADFYAFSGHKMIGPTGIGILYGKRALLEAMPPFMAGGDMIKRVAYEGAEWNDLPWKFEAGTPAIAEAIGLGAAVDYLSNVGMSNVKAHERAITEYALERLAEVPGLRVIGPPDASQKGAVCAFAMQDIHPHDVAQILDHEGVAVRAGHHCAMPLHHKFGLVATTRASFYLYNTFQEVDRLIEALYRAKTTFAI